MSKKPKTKTNGAPPVRRITEEFSGAPEDFNPFPSAELVDDGEDVNKIVQSLGAGKIEVKVDQEQLGDWAFCFATSGTINEEAIRNTYGPGRFRVRIFKDGALHETVYLRIAARIDGTAAALQNSGTLAGMQNDATLRIMEKMFSQQMSVMSSIIQAVAGRDAPQTTGPSIIEIIQLVKELGQKGDGAEKVVEILMRGIELGRESGGKEPESFGQQMLKVVSEVAPAFLGNRQLTAGNPPVEQNPMNKEAILRDGINFLKGKCSAGSHPDLYLSLILDNGSAPLYQGLIQWVCETSWEEVCKFDPDLGRAPHEQFFRKIYDGLRREFGVKNSVVPHSGGKRGNKANPVSDANPGGVGPEPSS
jgi:hypothetical protein